MDCLREWISKNFNTEEFKTLYKTLTKSQQRYLRLIKDGKRSGKKLLEQDSWLTDFILKGDWEYMVATFERAEFLEEWIEGMKDRRGIFDDLEMAERKLEELKKTGLPAYIVVKREKETDEEVYEVYINSSKLSPLILGNPNKKLIEKLREC